MDEINVPDDLSGLTGDELKGLLSEINEAGKTVAAEAREAEGADRDTLVKTLNELKDQKARIVEAIELADVAAAEAEATLAEAEAAFEDGDDEEETEAPETEEAETEEAPAEVAEPEVVAATATKGAKFSIPKRSREIPAAQESARGATFKSGGATIDSLEGLMRQFQSAERMAGRNDNGRAMLASFNRLPDGLEIVRGDKSAWDNTRAINRAGVTGDDILTAAGGFCGPAEAITDITRCGRSDTPVGDLLTKFTARGKYRYIHQVGLDDVFTDGTQYWTEEDDTADPLVPKTCYTLACDEEVEARPIMIPACFTYGVGQAWSNPEQVAAALAKFDVALARRSEALVLQRIHEQSNQVTFTPPVGESTQNALVRLVGELLAWAGYGGRNSTDGYVFVIPETLALMAITDAAIKAWVGPTLTRAQIVGQLEDLFGVRVVLSPDVRALGTAPIDALPAAPAPAGGANEKPHPEQEVLLFKPEDFKHGLAEVDVAVQTDITTARRNDRNVFLETVESTEKLGCSASFSALIQCADVTGAQPDLVASDDTYSPCPAPSSYTFPGASI